MKLEERMRFIGKNIKFNKEDIYSKDPIQKPIFVIADSIEVYLMTDNAVLRDFNIAIIAESLDTDLPKIFVDKYFTDLDYASQLFTIYHELGHYVNKDLTRDRSRKENFYNKIEILFKSGMSLEEQRADLFAYNKIKEHYPSYTKNIVNIIFNDLKDSCIKQLKEEVSDTKSILKYTKRIEKEINKRKETLMKNIDNGCINFYDPNKK